MEGKKQAKDGVDYNPPVWKGPSTPVPREMRENGVDLKRYEIDPKDVAKFPVFENQK